LAKITYMLKHTALDFRDPQTRMSPTYDCYGDDVIYQPIIIKVFVIEQKLQSILKNNSVGLEVLRRRKKVKFDASQVVGASEICPDWR